MKLLQLLNPRNNQKYASKDEYKREVLEAVQILNSLGISDDSSSDIEASVKSVLEKLQEDEEAIYGRKRSKQEILEELNQVNAEIADVDAEIADLEHQLAMKKAKLAFS